MGQQHEISLQEYNNTQQLFQNFQYGKEVIKTYSHGYTTIGDKYKRSGHGNRHWVLWPQTWETSKPLVEKHTYENRLHTLSSWRNFKEEEVKELGLFEYPSVQYHSTRTILSQGLNFPLANTYGQYLNGKLNTLGSGYKKVRIWVLVFVDKDRNIADEQEIYWKGGNKNEFVVMMSVGKEAKLQWAHIMSPTEVDTLKIEVRDKLTLKEFKVDDDSMLEFMKWLGEEIKGNYIKPDYRQYAYIEVVPSLTAISISYFIIFLVNIGVGIFVIKNEWHDKHNDEITTVQAFQNVRNAFSNLLYEILKALGIIRLMDKFVKKPEVKPLTEGDTIRFHRPISRPISPPPAPKPIRRKRRP